MFECVHSISNAFAAALLVQLPRYVQTPFESPTSVRSTCSIPSSVASRKNGRSTFVHPTVAVRGTDAGVFGTQ